MRNLSGLVVLAGVALWLGGGCARPRAATIAPTLDELPHFEHTERILPLSVGIEGRGDEPRVMLVPSFEEPELTPEEREALGQDQETAIDWLEFYQALPAIMRVWSETGGVSTAIHGSGGPAVGRHLSRRPVGVGGQGGVALGAHGERDTRYGKGAPAARPYGKGSRSGVSVGVNPARRISSHQTRPEP